MLERLGAGRQSQNFRARLRRYLGVIDENELARLRELVLDLFPHSTQLDNSGEPPVLTPQVGESMGIPRSAGLGELALDLGEARERLAEPVAETQVFFPPAGVPPI
ncbi:MAG: hypothetical protein NVS1B4_11940 [Gemmatimonadaceae bacterium]